MAECQLLRALGGPAVPAHPLCLGPEETSQWGGDCTKSLCCVIHCGAGAGRALLTRSVARRTEPSTGQILAAPGSDEVPRVLKQGPGPVAVRRVLGAHRELSATPRRQPPDARFSPRLPT